MRILNFIRTDAFTSGDYDFCIRRENGKMVLKEQNVVLDFCNLDKSRKQMKNMILKGRDYEF